MLRIVACLDYLLLAKENNIINDASYGRSSGIETGSHSTEPKGKVLK